MVDREVVRGVHLALDAVRVDSDSIQAREGLVAPPKYDGQGIC